MAYKQTPGRSPFPKTGRDIPLNFLSPLHTNEKGGGVEDWLMRRSKRKRSWRCS